MFPGCGPTCFRKKKLDALQYAKDSEAYEVALHGHGWVQAKKEKEATLEADSQVSIYKNKFNELQNNIEPSDSEEVKDMKYQIERDSTLAAILNRLTSLFYNHTSTNCYFSALLDLIITVLAIYLIYIAFLKGRIVGGKRLVK
jgi:hypothetical protein